MRNTMNEIELIEKTAVKVGMKSLLNHGAASCVYSEGCNGVTQAHLVAFTREVALHCVAALAPAHGVPVIAAGNPALDQGPCTVCGKLWRDHGTAPVYEDHNYTPVTAGVPVPGHQDSPQPTGGNGNVNQQERDIG